MILDLDVDLWYVRLFFSSLRVWRAFTGNPRFDEGRVRGVGTNLCFFVRVVIAYAPFVYLLHAALAVAAVFVLAVFPVSQIGLGPTLTIAAGIAGVALLVLAYHRWRQARRWTPRPARRSELQRPSAWEVLRAYAAAVKQRVCPLVTFTEVPR